MNQTRAKVIPALTALIAVAGLTMLTATPASAATEPYENKASMICGEGTGYISFGLPIYSDGRYSVFYYRVDGGPWQQFQTYWTVRNMRYLWNGTYWQQLPVDSSAGFVKLGNGHYVQGWEARYYPNGTSYGVALASCWTSDWSGPYITFG